MDKVSEAPAPAGKRGQETKKLQASELGRKSASSLLVTPGAAFLVGVAVGAAIEEEKPRGTPAHVHLSLSDEDKSPGQEHQRHHDDGQDCCL